jgi:hypothetical protein
MNRDATYNVRQQIRQFIKDTGITEPEQIADQIASLVPEEFVQEVLAQALRALAREELAADRPHGRQLAYAAPVPVRHSAAPAAHSAGGRQPARGAGRRGDEIRDAWQRVLEAFYATPDGRKQLKDFTRADCEFQGAQLDAQVERLQERRRSWNTIAMLLTEHNADTVADLPAEVKLQAFGGQP